jgi:O-antigen ligase
MTGLTRKDIFPLLALLSYLLSIFFYEHTKAWMSISMFVLLILPFIVVGGKSTLHQFVSNYYFPALSFCAIYLLFYYFNSANHSYFWNRIVMRGPLLALPLVAAGMCGVLSQNVYRLLLKVFVVMCLAGSFYSLFYYITDYASVTDNYLKAQVMPTIINHVRFSIMVAMACYVAYYLVTRKHYFLSSTERWIWIGVLVYLILFLHLYSVRSGLIALYSVVLVELFLNVKGKLGWRRGAVILTASTLFLTTAIYFIPTLHNKWKNTIEDIQVYTHKKYANHNSLTTRFISYEAAVVIFKDNPLLGCGLGDVKDKTDIYFKEHYPEVETPILPHNQFMFMLAATGLVGFILFVLLFYSPLLFAANRKNSILVIHYVILTVSFMTEPMLETQLGMGYSMLFIMLPLMMKQD